METETLKAALEYVERGFSVIPCRPDKKPYLPWTDFQKRRAMPDEIRGWLKKWPDAMVAVVTGKISGVLVLDCDTREGYEAIQKLLPEALLIPIARTPRGGWHLWFIYPMGSNLTVAAGIMPGVDFRGEGGYVIAPPSRNGDGKGYAWQGGLALGEVEPAAIPDALIRVFNNSLYRGGVDKTVDSADSSRSHDHEENIFRDGVRDDNLYHIALCLANAKNSEDYTFQVLMALQRSWGEHDERWARDKVKSAFARSERKERNLAAEIREWVLSTSGVFLSTELYGCLQLSTRDERKNVSIILKRISDEGIIERSGQKNGCYRRVENEAEDIDFRNVTAKPINLKWPLEIEKWFKTLPKNIIVIAGSPDAGKSAYLLNFVKENMKRHSIHYFSSEMGAMELSERLSKFAIPLSDWTFTAKERSANFADVIRPNDVNVIDYLELTSDFWKVSGMLTEIHNKLDQGIAVIGLQKPRGRDTGLGGDKSLEKPRLYLSMEKGTARIIKCKNWACETNPNGLALDFKLVQGCQFKIQRDWYRQQ